MANKGNFVQEAKARFGREKKDASIIKERKGELTETTMGVSHSGKPTQTIVVF